jgi:Zn/Cd-binding protein ZinT
LSGTAILTASSWIDGVRELFSSARVKDRKKKYMIYSNKKIEVMSFNPINVYQIYIMGVKKND